ncbi:MAG: hypothetical protein ACE5MM_11105 [Nitrospiraceae bacterium]
MIHCHYPHCVFAGVLLAGLLSCAPQSAPPVEGVKVFVGARIVNGTGNTPIENAVMLVREGRIEAVGAGDSIQIPDGAQRIDVSGKTIIPGLINSHGHVGGTKGLESGPEHYSQESVLRT